MSQAIGAHARARARRWVALVGGLWILSSGGLSYNFAIYSSQLKVCFTCPSRFPNVSQLFVCEQKKENLEFLQFDGSNSMALNYMRSLVTVRQVSS